MKNLELLQEVKTLLNEFAQKKKLSKNRMAQLLDVSAATLSNIEKEQSEKVGNAMLLKIQRALKPKDWRIVETANFNTIEFVCDDARIKNRMVGIIGGTGAGKTTGLNNYYKKNPNTYMVTCKKSMRPKELFEDMLTSMGISFTGTISRVIQKLTDELNMQDAPLIIIDEAGKLNQVVLMYLHDLWDGIENSSGIVLAGVGYFKTNLLKAVRKQKQGMPEFNSRIGYWQELANPTKAEIKAICKCNGVTDESEIKQVLNAKDFRYLNQIIKNKLR